jgi:hypothetical protein
MIIDAHVHVSAATDLGGFRTPPLTGEHLIGMMDGPFLVDGRQRRIDRAVLQPLISVPEGHDPIASAAASLRIRSSTLTSRSHVSASSSRIRGSGW